MRRIAMNLLRRDKNSPSGFTQPAQGAVGVLRTRLHRLTTRQDGIALVMVLLIVMLISILSVFETLSGQSDLRIATNEQDAKRALDIAEAGVRHAIALLGSTGNPNAYQNGFVDELTNGGTGGAL